MSDDIPEFTDTYSDDMIFLRSVRRSLLRHPLEYYNPKLLDATLARLYAVMLVGNAENAISQELERTSDPRLDGYLNSRALDNEQKVELLRAYLQERLSGAVDTEVLEDYLAIKYLRNGIIHSDRRKGGQAAYVTSRGMPIDSRELNLDHLHRLAQVDQAMTEYLGMAHLLEVAGLRGSSPGSMELPASRIASEGDVSTPYSINEFILIHRSNLYKVGSSWVGLLVEFGDLSGPDLVREVQTGNLENHVGGRIRNWGRAAYYSWCEIVRLWPDDLACRLVNDSDYRAEMLNRVRSLAVNGAFPEVSIGASAYLKLWRMTLSPDAPEDTDYLKLFGGGTSLAGSQLLETYALGGVAYELISNIGMGWIWPVLAQDGGGEFTPTANAFIDVVELARTWYAAIELHEGLDARDKDTLEQYRCGVVATQM